MTVRYIELRKKPRTFKSLVGVEVNEFDKILKKVTPLWDKEVVGAYKRRGRNLKLSVGDLLLVLMMYYRSYITHEFLGHLFGVHNSRVSRLLSRLEPLVIRVVSIKKERKLSREEVEVLLIDTTEQQINRPKRKHKKHYSGKKKKHTLKTEIRTTIKGRIVGVSSTAPGSVHDFEMYKRGVPVPKESLVFADSGYQGLQKSHLATKIPYKKKRGKKLCKEEKAYNTALSRVRIKVENVIRQLKIFKILSERYRNARKRYNLKFNIIAGIVNLKNGFVF